MIILKNIPRPILRNTTNYTADFSEDNIIKLKSQNIIMYDQEFSLAESRAFTKIMAKYSHYKSVYLNALYHDFPDYAADYDNNDIDYDHGDDYDYDVDNGDDYDVDNDNNYDNFYESPFEEIVDTFRDFFDLFKY